MIIDTEVEIIVNGRSINHYLNRGYDISVGDKLIVKIYNFKFIIDKNYEFIIDENIN